MIRKIYPQRQFLKYLPLLFIFCSCSIDEQSGIDYRVGKDGLIYNTTTNKLYTGRIVDTTEVIIEIEIVDGKKNGKFTTYYLNGNIEKQGLIKNNENEGEWKYFYEDGTIESVGHFQEDKPEGRWKFFHKNGIKREEGNFKNGKRSGRWIIYDEKGEVTNEFDFDSGEILKEEQNHS